MTVLKQNIAAFRACYTAGLTQKPSLAGRVMLSFTIDLEGKVRDSAATNSTLSDATVEKCLTLAAQRMQFAKPTGAPVQITYPLVFKSDGAHP
jgi:TonB family protein